MLAVIAPLAAALLSIGSVGPVVEVAGVRVAASIDNHIYTWTLTNLSERPITAFEVQVAGTRQHTAPAGWETEKEEGEDHFRAWTTDVLYAIGPGVSRSFTARVSSEGAPLGIVTAWVETGFGAQRVAFPAIWGPVPKRASMLALVASTLAIVAALHAVLVERRQRSTSALPGK